MKIKTVKLNNRKHVFEVTAAGRALPFPFVKADPPPTSENPVVDVYVDPELAREGFTYRLASGVEGSVHIEQALEYNADPGYLRDLLLYKLTIEAQRRVARSGLSRREIIRRLGTSPSQFYRLLDPTNYRKSIDSLLVLLRVLDCDVDLVVRDRGA